MSDLRTAAQQALEFLDAEFCWSSGEAPRIDALRAALEKPQENIIEAVRVQIMQTAYDCADNGEYESFNAVKVLCTDVLQILSRMGRA